ncbi:MAG: poly(A) polymerase [Desulfurivibrionaceae bacterium]|nr:poly(A) polymerase [Desulfurivibrionaceae bacterium]
MRKQDIARPYEEIVPLIVGPDEHAITLDLFDQEALQVMRRIMEAGHTAYLVGGGVRDLFMGKKPKDYDISTDARPGQLRKIFRNSRTIGRRFRLVQVFFPGNKIVEVSTFRCRSEYDLEGKDVVLAANNTYGDARDDAFRRDLTINGLFFEIENQTIIDYVGGVQDLKDRVVRIIGDAQRRITRDPVRMLRAVRHAARSNFRIEEHTWEAIKIHHNSLAVCPVSRIRDEFFKDLRGGASALWLKLAVDSGLFGVLMPCYADLLEDPAMVDSLQRHLTVVDRLWPKEVVFGDDVLLSLLLLPWARKTFPELAGPLKIGEAFALSRRIREELSKNLLHIDISRMVKENVAAKLALLPIFEQHAAAKTWPKSLQKKSYFQENLFFYRLCTEAAGGELVDENACPRPSKRPERAARPPRQKSRERGRGPAWTTSKQKGGVFGFKR